MAFTIWVSPLPDRCRGVEAVWRRCSFSPCLGMTRHRAPAMGMPDSYALKRYDSATLPAGFSTPPSDGFNCCFKAELRRDASRERVEGLRARYPDRIRKALELATEAGKKIENKDAPPGKSVPEGKPVLE